VCVSDEDGALPLLLLRYLLEAYCTKDVKPSADQSQWVISVLSMAVSSSQSQWVISVLSMAVSSSQSQSVISVLSVAVPHARVQFPLQVQPLNF